MWLVIFIVILLIVLVVSIDIEPSDVERKAKVWHCGEWKALVEFRNRIYEDAKVKLSCVIPSFNEELRLPKCLDYTIKCLNQAKWDWEIIVVDDGSSDRTSEVAINAANKYDAELIIIRFNKNRGKGMAVRMGTLCSSGNKILIMDSDGATEFTDVHKLMSRNKPIVFGSRKNNEIIQRSSYRSLLTSLFHFIVRIFITDQIQDTQCGFKLFTKEAAQKVVTCIRTKGWAFDCEAITIANRLNYEIDEVPVHWTEIAGSKLNVFTASFAMVRDIIKIWLLYYLDIWKPVVTNV